MERIVGIGGVFLRARDPEVLADWYARHLGLPVGDGAAAELPWTGQGSTVWALFPRDSDYLGARDRSVMVNFRVRDLDAMLRQLRASGVRVDTAVEESAFGRFCWLVDPEGNRVELWEPPTEGNPLA